MKAIILAAGKGTRLQKYAKDLPKAMLKVKDKPLIVHQIETLKSIGINDVAVVTGYMKEKFLLDSVTFYENKDYATTNMVESLFCAEKELDMDILITYGDIVYDKQLLERVVEYKGDFGVVVDVDWKDYWRARYDKIQYDLETLSYGADKIIQELGDETNELSNIDARYVGMIKLSDKGLKIVKEVYHGAKRKYWDKPWQKSGNLFQNAYMTDFLQELIDQEYKVEAIETNRGWLEFDTNEDYERMSILIDNGNINSFINFF